MIALKKYCPAVQIVYTSFMHKLFIIENSSFWILKLHNNEQTSMTNNAYLYIKLTLEQYFGFELLIISSMKL